MITRKPPGGLEGAPYLVEHKISVADLKAPLKVFDGTARDGARGFPANVNVAAALSLAGIGPDRTQLEIWADPALTRNTHRIEVDADVARFSMTIEGIPSAEPAHRPHRAAVHHRGAARAGVGAESGDLSRRRAVSGDVLSRAEELRRDEDDEPNPRV